MCVRTVSDQMVDVDRSIDCPADLVTELLAARTAIFRLLAPIVLTI